MCATVGLEGACFGLLCVRTQPRSEKDACQDLGKNIWRHTLALCFNSHLN